MSVGLTAAALTAIRTSPGPGVAHRTVDDFQYLRSARSGDFNCTHTTSVPVTVEPMSTSSQRVPIPRDPDDDFTRDAADARARFVSERTGVELNHVGAYSFDPAIVQGNVEHFIGAAQVPIGLAGPLLVNGEHAQGEFYVPMATAEGTLVASYNRGMRLLHEAGGVTTTVVRDHMQRAPAFLFTSAREAQAFGT